MCLPPLIIAGIHQHAWLQISSFKSVNSLVLLITIFLYLYSLLQSLFNFCHPVYSIWSHWFYEEFFLHSLTMFFLTLVFYYSCGCILLDYILIFFMQSLLWIFLKIMTVFFSFCMISMSPSSWMISFEVLSWLLWTIYATTWNIQGLRTPSA